MASDLANQGGRVLSTVLHFLKIFTLNSWRRLLILSRYTVICFHQQRLRRAWRVLGKQIHLAVAGGEVNPMLTEEVKDDLARAQAIQTLKDGHYQAIAALREKIRASRVGEAPPPAEEAPAVEEAAQGPPPEPQTSQEERRS